MVFILRSVSIPKSPCIGVCSTGIGDAVCRGCKRFAHEVIAWNGYSAEEKRLVLQRIASLAERVIRPIIEIEDEQRLADNMRFQQIRFDPEASPYLWLLELLKMGANQISGLENFGCRIHAEFRSLNLQEIQQRVNEDFYTLSCAHYERYFSSPAV